MEEMEEEYDCTFLYGHALAVVSLVDVRQVRRGDEEKALMDEIDPEACCWVLADVRPVIPFPVKGRQGLFEVDDSLITEAPFKFDQTIVVRGGTVAEDLGIDFSGWHGRVSEVLLTEEGEPRAHVTWDSVSLRSMPLTVIEKCVREGFDWTGVLVRLHEIEHAEPRDTWDDVRNAIEDLEAEHFSIFQVKRQLGPSYTNIEEKRWKNSGWKLGAEAPCWLAMRYFFLPFLTFRLSLNAFPAVNFTAFLAGIFNFLPVAGLRPSRAARSTILKLPNPIKVTVSPARTASMIEARVLSIAAFAAFLVTSRSLETFVISSAFVMSLSSI